jgi:hypothetical protein
VLRKQLGGSPQFAPYLERAMPRSHGLRPGSGSTRRAWTAC